MTDIKKYQLSEDVTLRESVKKLDELGVGIVICVDENENVMGILTNGDFRKLILKGANLNDKLKNFRNKYFTYLESDYTKDDVHFILQNKKIDQIPVLNNKKLTDIIFRNEYVNPLKNRKFTDSTLPLSVVIMAGGLGTRMLPITKIIPKPLMQIGDYSIIETIIAKYSISNVNRFYISVNYKANMIKSYIKDLQLSKPIEYLEEQKPLGTIGALYQLNTKVQNTILLTNCDTLIYEDVNRIYNEHKQKESKITIIGTLKHVPISYGVCKTKSNGSLVCIDEKPNIDFLINTGTYFIEPDVLKYIPANAKYDAVDLINRLLSLNLNIDVYPTSNNNWVDLGQMNNYNNYIKQLDC